LERFAAHRGGAEGCGKAHYRLETVPIEAQVVGTMLAVCGLQPFGARVRGESGFRLRDSAAGTRCLAQRDRLERRIPERALGMTDAQVHGHLPASGLAPPNRYVLAVARRRVRLFLAGDLPGARGEAELARGCDLGVHGFPV